MQSKISHGWSVFIAAAVVIAFTSIIISYASTERSQMLKNSNDSALAASVVSSASAKEASSTLPIRLVIPKINVSALIEDAGITSNGAMAVPKGPSDVTWFDLGPRPGEIGSSVIAGHEGWKDGIAAVFDNLHQLQKGDEIYIVNASGATTTFVVIKMQLYGQYENAADVFNSTDGLVHLNLITCEGIWNAAEKSYSNRLIVFAVETTTTASFLPPQ